MTSFPRHLRILALWLVASPALAMVNPWGGLGWLELIACLAPLGMLIERRIEREAALAAGIPLLTILWLFAPLDAPIARLLVAWSVFAVGVFLASRSIESQKELEEVAGQVAYAPNDPQAVERFQIALDRELGRSRRHDRPFAILSAAAHPHSLEADASGLFRSELLRALAENRARLELQDFLRSELHLYCDVATIGPRVLALVPEIDDVTLEVLIERLRQAADERFDFDVQIGAGCFPRDAVCAEEMIDVADRNRTASKLRSLPERVGSRESDVADLRSPDVQG